MTPTQLKLAFVALALTGAGIGGGAAYLLTHSGQKQQAQSAAAPATPAATAPGWTARIENVAGDGLSGTLNGPARGARFADPYGVAIDADGVLYVADGGEGNSIRKVDTQGNVSVLAGGVEGYAEGSGKLAAFNTPSGVAIDGKGNLYVADTGNNAIRKVAPDGTVSTLAGNSIAGSQDGRAPESQFNGPLGVAVDKEGNVYVADTYNDRIRRISWEGIVTTIAGGRAGNADGPAAQALFDTPSALALAPNGDIYVADTGNNAIRKIARDGNVSTVAAVTDDKERDALLRRPIAIALTRDGYLYVASGSHGRIAQVSPKGEVLPLHDVDHPPQPNGSDGIVRLYAPRALALARDGSLYASDAATFRLHHIAPPVDGASPPEEVAPPVPPHAATMLWPFKPQDKPHEVVGLMGEVRGNYDHESRDHFHAGLDVQGNVGTPVLAVLPGKVRDPLAAWGYGELGEGMALDGLLYIHMKVGRTPSDKPLDPRFVMLDDDKGKPYRVRIKRGTRFLAGETLGTVNRMAHVHLDYRPNGDALNPLTLPFIGLQDSIAPTISSIQLIGPDNTPLKDKRDGRLLVPRQLGDVQVVVDAYDQMDGDKAKRRLGLYKLGYQLLRVDGSALPDMAQPTITQLYDRLPRYRDAVKVAYSDASGITVYGSKETHFAYALNNSIQHGKVVPGSWKVSALEPGNYILRIIAEDYAGNAASKDRDLPVTVE